jgi:hypothetical protein
LITFFYSLVKKNLNFYSINIKLNFSLFNNLKKQFNLIINKLYLMNFFIFKKDKSFLFKESIRFKIKKKQIYNYNNFTFNNKFTKQNTFNNFTLGLKFV